MRKLYYLTALILTIPFFVFAQSNYKPGYVVTVKGDTVRGFINYQEWDANPEAITFKKALDSQGVKYGVNDISSFGIDKLETFVRYSGKISTNPVAIDNVVTDAESAGDTSFRVATVFLKVLEKGNRVALYSYRDDIKLRLYVGNAPDYTPIELIYRLTRTNTERTYQKQLSAVALRNNELNDALITRIARSEYNEDNVLDIVSRINHVSKIEFDKTHYSGGSLSLFAGAGISICTTSPSSVSPYAESGGTSHTSVGPQASFGLTLYANPATRALQFRLELSAGQNKFQSLYTLKVSPYKPTEVLFTVTSVCISPQIIYNVYNTDNFKAFVGVGVAFRQFSYSNAYFGTQNHDGTEANIAQAEPFGFSGSDNAMLGKAGIQIGKHLVIYGAVESNVTVTETIYFSLSSSYKQIGLNYIF